MPFEWSRDGEANAREGAHPDCANMSPLHPTHTWEHALTAHIDSQGDKAVRSDLAAVVRAAHPAQAVQRTAVRSSSTSKIRIQAAHALVQRNAAMRLQREQRLAQSKDRRDHYHCMVGHGKFSRLGRFWLDALATHQPKRPTPGTSSGDSQMPLPHSAS
jgi:hypothetical protein